MKAGKISNKKIYNLAHFPNGVRKLGYLQNCECAEMLMHKRKCSMLRVEVILKNKDDYMSGIIHPSLNNDNK